MLVVADRVPLERPQSGRPVSALTERNGSCLVGRFGRTGRSRQEFARRGRGRQLSATLLALTAVSAALLKVGLIAFSVSPPLKVDRLQTLRYRPPPCALNFSFMRLAVIEADRAYDSNGPTAELHWQQNGELTLT